MFIARILYPVKVLGPGNRIGIWFDGCEHRCDGCSNPELWEQESRYETNLETLMKLIHSVSDQNDIDGFTLTGGDPFFQPKALQELLPELQKISRDILVYTGYRYEILSELHSDILDKITVLIDGPYLKERNNGAVLRGSDNQRVLILNQEHEELYQNYLNHSRNEIQNFKTRDAMISVGIHRPEYKEELDRLAKEKGLIADE